MSDFKLKTSVEVAYDKENDSYVFGHFDETKFKKVTSRAFSCLLGSNHFTSIGSTILERFKLLESQAIDEYWGVRGDMAELLVLDFLRDMYGKQGIKLDLRTWTKEEVSYDNFKRNEKFGGLLDIAIANPEEHRAVIEVKSKSLKDVDKIKGNRGNIEEVLQGKFLTYLSNVTKCLMVYVFFTPEQDQAIKNYVKENNQDYPGMNFARMLIAKMDLTPESMKILVFKHTLDIPRVKNEKGDVIYETPNNFNDDMNKAYDTLLNFKATKTISSKLFGANDISLLKGLTNQLDNPF